MKQITLNSDRTLNILDTSKVYIFKTLINDKNCAYYIGENYIGLHRFVNITDINIKKSLRNIVKGEYVLGISYSLQEVATEILHHYGSGINIMLQFNDIDEFLSCMAKGII